LFVLSPQKSADALILKRPSATQVNVEILDGHYSQYTPELVKVATEKGRLVWADNQQKEEGSEFWEKAIQTDIHGMQTDSPLNLIQFSLRLT
jgi:hypothetical protein